MLKVQQNLKIFTEVAEEIIDLLMEGTIEEESTRFEIGKKLFQLEEKLNQKKRQLPNQQGISPAELLEMKRFYKAKAYFLEKFGKENSCESD